MVIAFEEKDRAAIEAKGITIIEFKMILYRTGKGIEYVWKVMKEATDKIVSALNALTEGFIEVVDSVKMALEVVKDVYHYQTSFRYNTVKILSKCTGIEMWKLWKMTRHTRLARSCC